MSVFELHTQVIHDKSVNIGLFFQHFTHGFASSMSGFAVDADNGGIRSIVARLQRSGEFIVKSK